ncbi:MAG: T9SS type A sorting domain-containing protein [Bacteroidetes bacterium]|nr:T9SS type A sorting domain-containing protein [Bacteroidota bacterium]
MHELFRNNENKENYLIEVRNIVGQIVYEERIDNYSGKLIKKINMSEQNKGVYFISIASSLGTKTKKIVIY